MTPISYRARAGAPIAVSRAFLLTEVVLVGHGYGVTMISGVPAEVPERIRRLVYLDAALPGDGESLADLLPSIVDSAEGEAPVPSWASPDAPYPKDVPQSLRTVTQPIELAGTGGKIPGSYGRAS